MKYIDSDPEIQEMQAELKRLLESTDNFLVQKLLKNVIDGLAQDSVDWPNEPFLVPVEIENPDVTFVGPEGSDIGNLPCVQAEDGSMMSVWYSPSFMHRWAFFVNGRIGLSFFGTPPPVSLRFDVYNGFVEE